MSRKVYFASGAGIAFFIVTLILNGETRGDIINAIMFKTVSGYSLFIVAILFVTYRGSSIFFKFKKIFLLDQEILFPVFTLYFSHLSIKYSEIKSIKKTKPLGGVIIATDSGGFIIKEKYFENGSFHKFLSELEIRTNLKMIA